MPIETRSSDEQVVGGKKYTGLANMLVTAMSPSLEEIKARGGRADKEPAYTTNEFVEAKVYNNGPNGSWELPAYNFSRTRIDIYLYIAQYKFSNKLAIWLDDRPRWNNDRTKVEWINRFGGTAWTLNDQILEENQLEVPPNYTWFSKEGARPALGGEGQFTKFMQAWANSPLDAACSLDYPEKLAKGDFTEIRKLLKDIPTNEVKILNGVRKVEKDGKVNYYSAAYSGYFGRKNVNDFSKWREALASDYGKFDADYQNDLTWREWIGDPHVEGNAPTNLDVPGGPTSTSPVAPPQFTF
jgi:hypothetical protein